MQDIQQSESGEKKTRNGCHRLDPYWDEDEGGADMTGEWYCNSECGGEMVVKIC